ncbi:origin of replication complex subunit 1B-like [Wolffia australiana]
MATLQPSTPRRSPRLVPETPRKRKSDPSDRSETPISEKKSRRSSPVKCKFAPVSPDRSESGRRRRTPSSQKVPWKRIYYKRVEYDGGEFEVGDDVYVKRREDAESDEDDPAVEDCRVCFKSGRSVMIECDECLGGFHLKCLSPPLKKVPEVDWICAFCVDRKLGRNVELPKPPPGKKLRRTFKEKLLSSDLWAARIECIWEEPKGEYWAKVRWYIIPEETAVGRQPHNLRRELYCTKDSDIIEMDSILRQCYVMNPKDFSKADNEGDDVFLCEYEYNVQRQSFKRLAELDGSDDGLDDTDEEWKFSANDDQSSDEDSEYENESPRVSIQKAPIRSVAANSCKGRIFGLQKIGMKTIPEHVRSHKQTELERAKHKLLLATLPKSLPCRSKEMEEITLFIKNAISEDNCLGRCLYIHGVPGTGKTMTVHAAMRNLRSEVDSGDLAPYSLVEINGLKLSTPETIYRAIYESLTGHRVGWKKALHLLNERFCEGKKLKKEDRRPCVLLIDELDLLVTKNQSVLYNILDWPTRPNSGLIVMGIANTMDLPEKLLPRISSRMGIQRLCFGPYNYQQLQEIISSRLRGVDIFEEQAIEFASRKVAAISGDARRALEICRRAAELVDYRQKEKCLKMESPGTSLVGIDDVESAIQEMFQAPHIQVIKSSSRLCKIFLVTMVHEIYRTGLCELNFEKLAAAASRLCASNGEEFPGWDVLFKVGCKLGECKIILCEEEGKHRLQKMQLNFPSDDVGFALKGCSEVPWLAKYL